MKDAIPDNFDEKPDMLNSAVRIVTVKYFHFESEARLYAARLAQEGIPCFVSNTHSITAFPLTSRSIGLNVKSSDLERAAELVNEMERRQDQPLHEDFLDADLGDIEYQKRLHKPAFQPIHYLLLFFLILSILLTGIFH
ncbi:MAG: hypothetical protein D6714_21035 [Bacteroidetes bacterium]|nr:MAG: hypothetical protein D6714_21035 [Bacteroidota bacterium]